jgi:hypothetical protein
MSVDSRRLVLLIGVSRNRGSAGSAGIPPLVI